MRRRGSRIMMFISMGVLFISASSVHADGIHFSDQEIHLNQPNQKAVITYNGKTETLILSSAVMSADIANFAWVVPIRSVSKPEVIAGNISIFKDLVNYFKKPEEWTADRGLSKAGGVTVLETKEIDVFDVTILKATDANALIDWLNTNGYKFPPEMKEALDSYVKKGSFYFVANKIDLKNKFKDEIEAVGLAFKKIDGDRKKISEPIVKYFSESIGEPIKDFDDLANYIKQKASKELEQKGLKSSMDIDLGNGLALKGDLIFEPFYKAYSPCLGYGQNIKEFRLYKNDKPTEFLVYNMGVSKDPDYIRENVDIKKRIYFANPDREKLTGLEKTAVMDFLNGTSPAYDKFISEIIAREEVLNSVVKPLGEPVGKFIEEFQLLESYKIWLDNDNFRKNKTGIMHRCGLLFSNSTPWPHLSVEQITDGRMTEERMRKFYDALSALARGVGTPLKFQFDCHEAWYPLEVSRLNGGNINVEVYVIDKTPVKDINDILRVDEAKEIDATLRSKLKTDLELKNSKYVTRLLYNGKSSGLISDSVFVEK